MPEANVRSGSAWRRNLAAYAVLLLCLLAVHFVIGATHATRSVSQAAVFSWTGLGIVGALGLLGVVLNQLGGLEDLWPLKLGAAAKVWTPLALGLSLGALALVTDLFTQQQAANAARHHLPSINIVFPLSVPIYFGGAILVTIVYFMILIPLVVWLVSTLILKRRYRTEVFWAIAAVCIFIEPVTQGEFADAMRSGGALLGLLCDIALGLGQVWCLRRSGLIAAINVRLGYYAVWHVLYGLIQGVY